MKDFPLDKRVLQILEEIKAVDPVLMDVGDISGFADAMIVATGTSTRHIRSMHDALVSSVKEMEISLLGVEGKESNDWVLIDLGDLIVHLMRKETREFYDLEKFWSNQKLSNKGLGETHEDSHSIDF
ncbi:MAG: ribosome silencing factor [Candidatus Azotimanducaceae bacterium]